jgi:hypothetical protein
LVVVVVRAVVVVVDEDEVVVGRDTAGFLALPQPLTRASAAEAARTAATRRPPGDALIAVQPTWRARQASGRVAQPAPTALERSQALVELVDDGHARGDLELGDVLAGHLVEVLDKGPQAVAVGRHQYHLAGEQGGRDGVVPVRDHAHHDVGQALRAGHDAGHVAGVGRHVEGGTRLQRGRRHVVAPAPQQELLVAIAVARLRLVQAGQAAVVTLVEPPVPVHRHPQPRRLFLKDVEGADGPGEHGRKGDVGQQTFGREEAARLAGLLLTVRRQVDVPPPGEAVFEVPEALAMTGEHESGHGPSLGGHRLVRATP